MARQRTSFGKLQRERDKQARSAAKQERRVARNAEPDSETPAPEAAPVDEAAILAALAELHEAYDAGSISLDDFENRRAELTRALQVD